MPPRLHLFSRVLERTSEINEIFEFGANVGINLHALHALLPKVQLKALEINEVAVKELKSLPWMTEVHHGSMLECDFTNEADLSFTSGVLIHLNPDELQKAYEALYRVSRKYIMICEYYNPAPMQIHYRGHADRLFKRDFAGEMMDMYPDLKLIDYGFCYHRDPYFPMDDLNWFIMEKGA
jgi:pseudaminic acid biosynthesis-associated methylase